MEIALVAISRNSMTDRKCAASKIPRVTNKLTVACRTRKKINPKAAEITSKCTFITDF